MNREWFDEAKGSMIGHNVIGLKCKVQGTSYMLCKVSVISDTIA